MNILFDNQIFFQQKFGGISRYYRELLRITGPDLSVELTETMIEKPDIKPQRSLFARGSGFIARRIFPQSPEPAELPYQFVNTLQGLEYDIFHPTYYDPYFLEFNRKPLVVTVYDMIHEIYAEHFNFAGALFQNKRDLCQRADRVITISETTKKDLVNIFKIPEQKVYAIPLASDFDKLSPREPDAPVDAGRYILYVGLRGIYKNFYFSIIALAALLTEDRELSLVCTGHPFSDDELLFFIQLDIASQVKHVYLRDDEELAWVYQHAKIFVFPSLYEGFGLPILEAFAMGCPVISSNGGSLQEVGGDAVLYFDPKSITAIQAAARMALYDDSIRQDLISKGTMQLKRFSWNRCREQTVAVYNSLY